MLEFSATKMAELVARGKVSSVELVNAHLAQIAKIQPGLNAVTDVLADSAQRAAAVSDQQRANGERLGALHGVPFSVKDSIDVSGRRTTAGTWGRRNAEAAKDDAAVVARLRAAGAIPIAKTNLPDLLFSFETDNLIFGRTSNPYDTTRTAGGSSGGEAALIAACGSPLGWGSDCLGSVRLPAAFCGIAAIKPTSGRLPRTGHVPPAGLWFKALWNIGPLARRVEDLELAMKLTAHPDGKDFRAQPSLLEEARDIRNLRVAFFTDNGFARCSPSIVNGVLQSAQFLEEIGMHVAEHRPPGVDRAYELELSILGLDGGAGIEQYLQAVGSDRVHPLHTAFVDHLRERQIESRDLARIWNEWDQYRDDMRNFFDHYDVVLCPVYTNTALEHGHSAIEANFQGFSYTMAWNLSGQPAATLRCSEAMGLPVNVQIVTRLWDDMTALAIASMIEERFGGWQAPATFSA